LETISRGMDAATVLRIAEKREERLRAFFDLHDADKSNTMDDGEILAVMEDMGMLQKLRSERVQFMCEMFLMCDANSDGVISFDEFITFHNEALDDSLGRRRPLPKLGRTEYVARQRALGAERHRRLKSEGRPVKKVEMPVVDLDEQIAKSVQALGSPSEAATTITFASLLERIRCGHAFNTAEMAFTRVQVEREANIERLKQRRRDRKAAELARLETLAELDGKRDESISAKFAREIEVKAWLEQEDAA